MGSKFSIEQMTTKLSRTVAHHFELEFLPAEDGFLDQRLMHGAGIEGASDGIRKFFVVVGDRAAGAAERERRANHDGIAELRRQARTAS